MARNRRFGGNNRRTLRVVEPTYAKPVSTLNNIINIEWNKTYSFSPDGFAKISAQDIADAIGFKKAYKFQVKSIIVGVGNDREQAQFDVGASSKHYALYDQEKPCKVRIAPNDPAGQWFNVSSEGTASGSYTAYSGPILSVPQTPTLSTPGYLQFIVAYQF